MDGVVFIATEFQSICWCRLKQDEFCLILAGALHVGSSTDRNESVGVVANRYFILPATIYFSLRFEISIGLRMFGCLRSVANRS
jgi:hypothetical protein